MNITDSNLVPVTAQPKAGQRVIQIAPGKWVPVGLGGKEPSVDTSSDTAEVDVILGVVDPNGWFQALKFDGISASTSGSAVEVFSYKTWNVTYATPIPHDYFFYASLSDSAIAETGQTLQAASYGNGISFQTYNGIPCLRLQDGSHFDITSGLTQLPSGNSPWSISLWAAIEDRGQTYGNAVFGWGEYPNNCNKIWYQGPDEGGYGINNIGMVATGVNYTVGQWAHVVYTYNGTTVKTYVNTAAGNSNNVTLNLTKTNWSLGYLQDGNYPFIGYIAGVRAYARQLNTDQVAALFSEFNPIAS